MPELSSWAGTWLEALYYAVFGPPLVLYAVFGLVLLLSPIVFVFWGRAPPIDRIWAGLGFFLIVVHATLKLL